MVGRLQFIGGWKNMENKIIIHFEKEGIDIELDIDNPDFAQLIHKVIADNLDLTKENVQISTGVGNFDTEELLDILVSVHEEFCEEIEKFYANIKEDIKTYYEDEELGEEIIRRICEDN